MKYLIFNLGIILFLNGCILGEPENFNNSTNNTNIANNSNNTNNINNSNNSNNFNNAIQLISGSLKVSTQTVSYNGMFAPANCSAIWIQKPDGEFVKTLFTAEKYYGNYLVKWVNASNWDQTDAVTQASRTQDGTITGVWNFQDIEQGDYEFWVEFTEDNGPGKWTSGTITIDSTPKKVFGVSTSEFLNLFAEFNVE